jgi:hypothetical protein
LQLYILSGGWALVGRCVLLYFRRAFSNAFSGNN